MANTFKYRKNDMFYDIESLQNIFTISQFKPVTNELFISYLDDGKLIATDNQKQLVKDQIIKTNTKFQKDNPKVIFEDISKAPELWEFMNRFRVNEIEPEKDHTSENYKNNKKNYPEYTSDKMIKIINGLYPVKETDKAYLESKDHEKFGRFFGFNSTNYDLTMLSMLMHQALSRYSDNESTLDYAAADMRSKNNDMFENHKQNMGEMLYSYDEVNGFQKKPGYDIKKSWIMTNRYIDVANLNEKQKKVPLKRLSGVLGLQILESGNLSANTDTLVSTEEAADLIAYNVSDVLNTKKLFEEPVYQTPFKLKSQLLKQFPQTIYDEKTQYSNIPYTQSDTDSYDHVKSKRLTSDSTSAQFIENIIAPYRSLNNDINGINYMYPSKKVAEELNIEPFDVLEDTAKWCKEHGLEHAFKPIYDFYKKIEGNNVNEQLSEKTGRKDNTYYVNMIQKETNTNYFYRDANGNKTASMVTFSIGGIHGAELKLNEFEKKHQKWQDQINIQNQIKERVGKDHPEIAHQENLPIENTKYTERNYLKSGSTNKKAAWKVIKEPTIDKKNPSGKLQIRKEYAYVSVDKANHEDVSSFYPLLLSNLGVFADAKGKDTYNEIYKRRLKLKAKLKDPDIQQNKDKFEKVNLEQQTMKLLLNSASGAGDVRYNSKIRKNNAIVSMRIIGQLIAFRIGQAEALNGARVPSTNTDGLYTMNIGEELNAKILEETVKPLFVNVEPETLDRFVTKDSNNRMEYNKGKVASAKGGTLTSHNGPSPVNSLNHPAIIDHLLAEYLAKQDDPCNNKFDREAAEKYLNEFMKSHNKIEILKFFQWIISSSNSSNRYVFEQNEIKTSEGNYETDVPKQIQHINRIFLTKAKNDIVTVKIAARRKVPNPTVLKRTKNKELLEQNDPEAVMILDQNGYKQPINVEYEDKYVTKISNMPEHQNVLIANKDLHEEDADKIINELDIDSYLNMLETTFNNSWNNLN